jgi:hypothetical protein
MLEPVAESPDRGLMRVPIPLDVLPVTVGRGSEAKIAIQQQWLPMEQWQLISRIHATVYREGAAIFVKDGGSKLSGSGCYIGGRKLNAPQRLYENIEVDISLACQGYRVYLTWSTSRPTKLQDFPTVECEREYLLIENTENQVRIIDLENALAEQEAMMTGVQSELKHVHAANDAQDRLIRKLRQSQTITRRLMIAFVVVGVVAAWRLLGGDTNLLEGIVGAVTIALSLCASAIVVSPQQRDRTSP